MAEPPPRNNFSKASRLGSDRVNRLAKTAREVRYQSLRMMAAKRWEVLRGFFTNRDHLWYKLLEDEEDELFRELSLAFIYVALGETQNAKRYLDQILRLSHEDARAQLLYAYVNLLENNGEAALVRYTQLLDHKDFSPRVRRILAVLKNTNSPYKLTLNKPLNFFYVHYERTWGDAFYYYRRSLIRKLRSPWGSFWMIFGVISLVGGIGFIRLLDPASEFRQWFNRTVYFWNLTSTAPPEQILQDLTLEISSLQEATPTAFNAAYYEKHFNDMKQAIRSGRPNAAIFIYNTVIQANPPLVLSEKFAILKTFVPIPQITSFENTISFADMVESPQLYVNTYWKLTGEVLAPRKLDVPPPNTSSEKQPSVRTAYENNIVFSFVVREDPTRRELVEVVFKATDVFPEEGEHYEILMSFVGLGDRQRPYMQGLVMHRLKK